MYLIRLKQVKQAFDAGNIDQACQMLTSDDYLCQRKEGKELLNKLADAFILRGNSHLDSGRYLQARLDCDNAKKCNIDNTGIIVLADSIEAAEKASLNRQRHNEVNLMEARDHLQNGRLTMGMKIIDDNESMPGASLLRKQAQLRQQQLQDIADKLKIALDNNDTDYVLQLIADLSDREMTSGKMTALVKSARDMVLAQIKSDFAAGRLARLVALLEKSRVITADSIEFAEWHELLNCYRQASEYIESGNYRKALQLLNRVKSIVSDADWLNKLLDSVERAIDAIDDIQLNTPVLKNSNLSQAKPAPDKVRAARPAPVKEVVKQTMANKILNIDGAGSYMLFISDKITIGPVSSIEKKDIAIIASSNSPLIEIHKDEDDYFVRAASGEIIVNGKKHKEALLNNGDKIAASDRSYVKFNRANPASSTAIIDLAGVRLPQADITAAIMADNEIIIGSSPSAHIKCRNCKSDIVLKVNANGGLEKDGLELISGTNVEYGNVRLCLV